MISDTLLCREQKKH